LPGLGAGAIAGAGLANRIGDRPGAGDRPSQLPNRSPEQRRDALNDRLDGRLDGNRPSNLPERNWDQRRQDWQDRRDDVRNDWQDHRDEARDDWQNFFDDNYGWYGGWYNGYAPGYWGRWDYLWDNYPVASALGLTWWGCNSLGYQYGYSDYYNPYYTETMPAYYTEPVITMPVEAVQETTGLPKDVSSDAIAQFDQARAAFYEGKYDEALKLADAAITKLPRGPRSLRRVRGRHSPGSRRGAGLGLENAERPVREGGHVFETTPRSRSRLRKKP
jgi:hypothetical protein